MHWEVWWSYLLYHLHKYGGCNDTQWPQTSPMTLNDLGQNTTNCIMRIRKKADHVMVAMFIATITWTPSLQILIMMTSSNGNIFHITGLFCGEFTGDQWIPRSKASNVELWCFLWSASEPQLSKQWKPNDFRHHRAQYDVIVMNTHSIAHQERWDIRCFFVSFRFKFTFCLIHCNAVYNIMLDCTTLFMPPDCIPSLNMTLF